MNGVKSAGARIAAFFAAACLALCVAAMAMPATAQADDDAVRNARTGVLKFIWSIDNTAYSAGSCFLVNDQYVVTAYHCVFPSQKILKSAGFDGQDAAELMKHITYSVIIGSDTPVKAVLKNTSENQDFAVLKLKQKLNSHDALPIRDSRELDAGDSINSLGFPADADGTKLLKSYKSDAVTVRSGTVNQPQKEMGFSSWDYDWNGYYLPTSVAISAGDSGGPMVDSNGNVVGVSVAGGDGYFYASASSELIDILHQLDIEYTPAPEPTPNPKPNPEPIDPSVGPLDKSALDSAVSAAQDMQKNSSAYTDEYNASLAEALEAATAAQELELAEDADEASYNEMQVQVNEAASALDALVKAPVEKPETPVALIAAIVVAALAIIGIIVALVMRSKKKKQTPPTQVPAGGTNAGSGTSAAGKSSKASWSTPGQGSASSPATVVGAGDSAETIVGGGDSSDTVVSYQKVDGGTLVRQSTNEKVTISNDNFTIGRQRGKVDYQVEGESVSRVHARIEVKDGKASIVDNNSANGTYVNNVKLRAGESRQLKTGDIIKISDEKFRYEK